MNWKIVVGILLIVGALAEMLSVIGDYRSGKLSDWPFGVEIGFGAMIVLGSYLIRKGQKEKNYGKMGKL